MQLNGISQSLPLVGSSLSTHWLLVSSGSWYPLAPFVRLLSPYLGTTSSKGLSRGYTVVSLGTRGTPYGSAQGDERRRPIGLQQSCFCLQLCFSPRGRNQKERTTQQPCRPVWFTSTLWVAPPWDNQQKGAYQWSPGDKQQRGRRSCSPLGQPAAKGRISCFPYGEPAAKGGVNTNIRTGEPGGGGTPSLSYPTGSQKPRPFGFPWGSLVVFRPLGPSGNNEVPRGRRTGGEYVT